MDLELRVLAILYVIVAASYLFFEKVIINYRPMIMPDGDGPEASFPSTHTFLVCTIMGSAIFVIAKLVKNEMLCRKTWNLFLYGRMWMLFCGKCYL